MNAVLTPSDPIPATPDERIAALLLQRGKLKEADLARARRLQEETGGGALSLLGLLVAWKVFPLLVPHVLRVVLLVLHPGVGYGF